MSYPLLEKAPKQDSPEFIDFLRNNNVVIWENDQWIVIENCKYHKPEAPWYTAFWKGLNPIPYRATELKEWYDDVDILWYEFGDYEWRKKKPSDQTVPKRFHIHLIK